MESEPNRVMVAVNESTIKGYPHAWISSRGSVRLDSREDRRIKHHRFQTSLPLIDRFLLCMKWGIDVCRKVRLLYCRRHLMVTLIEKMVKFDSYYHGCGHDN
ncbi:hypothetical protein SLE2022_190120 [Rubroshorea leprosula]